jgi:hypothetical protein
VEGEFLAVDEVGDARLDGFLTVEPILAVLFNILKRFGGVELFYYN